MTSTPPTPPSTQLLDKAETALSSGNAKEAEKLYQAVLSTASEGNANSTDASGVQQLLRDQERAVVKLGEMYRDQKYVLLSMRVLVPFRPILPSQASICLGPSTAENLRVECGADFYACVGMLRRLRV